MREFFKPLRRKIGVVTLVIACVFMAGWVRSNSKRDEIIVQDAGFGIWSALGGIQWSWKYTYEIPGDAVEWSSVPVAQSQMKYLTPEYGWPSVWYWQIVIPLTLISAWLLLSKPRKVDVAPQSLISDCRATDKLRPNYVSGCIAAAIWIVVVGWFVWEVNAKARHGRGFSETLVFGGKFAATVAGVYWLFTQFRISK